MVTSTGKIEIELLDSRHREGLLPMIATAFASDDPLARSQGIGESDFHQLVDSLYDNFVDCSLSFVARDTGTGQIAAVVLADDLDDEGDEGSDAIAALIDSARSAYFAGAGLGRARPAHIHFIASSPDYRRQRLVQRVVEACLAAARDRGFDRMLVEASGNRSRRLLENHFGFCEQVRVDYAKFSWNDRHPFRAIADHGGLSLMTLDLDTLPGQDPA